MAVQFITYFSLHKKDAGRYFHRLIRSPPVPAPAPMCSCCDSALELHQLQKLGEKSPVAEAAQSQYNLSSMVSQFPEVSVKAAFLTELNDTGN